MTKSLAELREQLSDIEPNERTYEGIGPSEVDLLVALLDDEEEWLAARAVHALSRIDSDNARQAVVSAAANPRMEVRVAAAGSADVLPARDSDEVLSRLLDDPHPAVRKLAIRSTSDRNSEAVRQRVVELASAEADTRLRKVAQEQARTIAGP
jgi:HEAT repeat protein